MQLALTGALATVGASACSASDFQYVSNETTATVFKVPQQWTLFDQDELGVSSIGSEEPQSQWVVAFDGAAHPSIAHVFEAGADEPAGYTMVRTLTDDDRDLYSPCAMRSSRWTG